MAKQMGADVVINPAAEDAVKKILAETGGTGVDVLLEMSGVPSAIQQGFKALRAGGRASLLGIPTENVPLDLVNDVIFIRAADVSDVGADDGAAEGGAVEFGAAFWGEDFIG
jgi:threonine dehydrogenase-like Zn-dependent dehydrogenase